MFWSKFFPRPASGKHPRGGRRYSPGVDWSPVLLSLSLSSPTSTFIFSLPRPNTRPPSLSATVTCWPKSRSTQTNTPPLFLIAAAKPRSSSLSITGWIRLSISPLRLPGGRGLPRENSSFWICSTRIVWANIPSRPLMPVAILSPATLLSFGRKKPTPHLILIF